jgi:hypothetical protein
MISRTLSKKLGNAREEQREMSQAVMEAAQQAVAAQAAIEDREQAERRAQLEEEARRRRMAAELDIGPF